MRKFEGKIKKLQNLQNRVTIVRSILLAIAMVLAVLAIYYGLYHLFSGRLERFYLALSFKVGLFLGLLYLGVKCMRSLLGEVETAALLDRFNSDKADTYQNAWELNAQANQDGLVDAVLELADKKANTQKVAADKSPLKQIYLIVAGVLLASFMMLIIDTHGYLESVNYFRKMKLPPEEHKETVEVFPGDIDLTRGSDLEISIIDPEEKVEHVVLWKQEKVLREQQLFEFKHTFSNLDFSFDYYVKTPYATSDTFHVNIFELPTIEEYLIKYKYPAYTGIEDQVVIDANGHIKAIEGTDVILEIKSNNPADTAEVIFDSGELSAMQRKGKRSFDSSFQLSRSGSYHVNIIDFLGNQNDKVEKSITAIADKVPEIEIMYPGRDTLLDQNMLMNLQFRASDDFGMHDLKIKYQINNEMVDSMMIAAQIKGSILESDYIFDLNDLWLLPGDNLGYWLEVTDNSPKQQIGQSQRYNARFPSISEIYQEIEAEEENKANFMEKALEESEELQKEFEEKRRELMKKEEYDWEDKKDLEKLLDKQENLSENIENMADSYQDLVDKMQNNKALSSETLEKMEKIQELMEEISNDQMMEAMQEMQKAMEEMDPEVMQKAMENMKFSMEDFADKIDQTLELLEQIKKEQTLQKAVELAEEMEKMQEDLNSRTENGEENTEKLAAEQAAQEERLKDLQKQMEEANSMMDPKKDSKVQSQMEELMESGLMDSLQNDISDASQQLSEQRMQKAQKSQQQAGSKMQRLKNKLQNMSSMMSMSSSAEIGEAIDLAIRSFIFMSQKQVKIINRYSRDPFAILPDLIAENEGINLALQKLYAVPMIVLALGPKFVYDVNYTMSTFRELFQYINDAKSAKVDDYLVDIQKGINLMIYDLMQSSQNMQQGGGGGGMQSLMQQLQQMSEQQMMMNMMTQQLYQQMMENGKPSQSMREEMGRLAAEEERMAENLKRMLQSNQEAQKQTAAMNKLIEDLEGISRELKRGRIDQDLIDTQERILSRLLDAQKSIHKREFSKKRKAENSEFLDWDTPEEIKMKFDKLRQKALLEENYQDFPPEYQDLIREYLKRLNSEE